MRVIAGKLKGRKLIGPRNKPFRPTLDRVRESIFNVLGEDLIDSMVLDLFCGSGALGIEAISRGAMRATFVDNDRAILKIARQNTVNLGIERKAKFVSAGVFDFLESSPNIGYNIVFADPPYDKRFGSSICNSIAKYDILQADGILVLERYEKESVTAGNLKFIKTLKFGQTEVDFYIREE